MPNSARSIGVATASSLDYLASVLVVDIRHWLDENGCLPAGPPALRRNALRMAQLIEYGGPLAEGHMRETLVPCRKRPARKACPGLMWVVKEADQRIYGFCMVCRRDEVVISGWQDTDWADGMMEPAPVALDGDAIDGPATQH